MLIRNVLISIFTIILVVPSVLAMCGDGIIDPLEDCDDANTNNNDGCYSDCRLDPSYRCHGEPSTCEHLGEVYAWFNNFSIHHFGAEYDELIYEKQGNEFELVPQGEWSYISENSASIAFETNLPAKSYIEYGTTTNYGMKTHPQERHFYLHIHQLTSLEQNTLYHYRIVAWDERGNILQTEDRTFTTITYPHKIEITTNGPHILDQDNTVYILKSDIESDTRAVTIEGNGIILDLNGHTITYDQGEPIVVGNWNDYLYSERDSTYGVYARYNGAANYKILNGKIVQGANQGHGSVHGVGFSPLAIGSSGWEVAGLIIEYNGFDTNGIENHYGGAGEIHHNILLAKDALTVTNRHQGVKAISGGGQPLVHHNLIKRFHHQGILGVNERINDNEVYSDSTATNSFSIGARDGVVINNNKIFATGSMPMGISWASNMTVLNNLIYVHAIEPPPGRSDEYGEGYSVWGIRLTQYGGSTAVRENNLYANNYIIAKAEDYPRNVMGFAISTDETIANITIKDNTVKILALEEQYPEHNNWGGFACFVIHGVSSRNDLAAPMFYENNTCFTNLHFVQFGSNYASGANTIFDSNTFIRAGIDHPISHPVQIGFWTYNTSGHRIINSKGDIDLRDYRFISNNIQADLGFEVLNTLYVRATNQDGDVLRNQEIHVVDNTGISYSTWTNDVGVARLEIINFTALKPIGETNVIHTEHLDHYAQIRTDLYAALPTNIFDNEESPVTITFSTQRVSFIPGDTDGNGFISLDEFRSWTYTHLEDLVLIGKHFS